MNVARQRLAIRRTDRVSARNCQPADVHDGWWTGRWEGRVANIKHAEIRICLFDDGAAHARAGDGQVFIDEEVVLTESVRDGAGRHRDGVPGGGIPDRLA